LFRESLIQYIHFMQNVAARLRAFMDKTGLAQEELARNAGVSQSTVCRALQGATIRGAAKEKLFSYAKIDVAQLPEKAKASRRLIAAFDRIWARSEMHAEAIVRIIDTLADVPSGRRSQRKTIGERRE
jgi:transcriptional regulator with XRE-family HTH domain